MRNRLLATLLCGFAPVAYGTHPLVSDDPDTQGSGYQQIEANTDWIRQDDVRKHIGVLTYTYGALDNLDLFFNMPLTFSSPSGRNDLSLGVKWRWQESDARALAIKPELLLPAGDASKALGNGRASMKLTGIVAYDAMPWRLIGNLGMSIDRYQLQADRDANRSVKWSASASAWYALNAQWKLLTDIGAERDSDKNSSAYPAFVLAGFMYSPNPKLDLDAGVKFNFRCAKCTALAQRQLGVGLTARF